MIGESSRLTTPENTSLESYFPISALIWKSIVPVSRKSPASGWVEMVRVTLKPQVSLDSCSVKICFGLFFN